MANDYDIIIIGAGPGGYETAAGAAARGLKTLLVERDALGGTCLNRGCIPTKCLCAGAEKLVEIKHAADFGIKATVENCDYAAAVNRAATVIAELRQGVEGLLANVEVVHGEASFIDGPAVSVNEKVYTAAKIVIATGSRPAPLRCPGAEFAIDSDAFLQLKELPRRIAIVGGGVIGLEFASIAAAYGSEVTVLEYCSEILPNFDADTAKRLRSLLGRRGIDIVTSAEVVEVKDDSTVLYCRKGKEKAVEADLVVSAVGRRPCVPAGCQEIGIELDKRGFIVTDDTMQTAAEGVYAIGDVNGRCLLAHAATAQGKVILGAKPRLDVMPAVVFTIPECASVGTSNEYCKSVKIPYGACGKALASEQTDGFLKLDYMPDSGKVMACHAVGAHASDLIAIASTAICAGMTLDDLREHIIFAHPTLSELLSL